MKRFTCTDKWRKAWFRKLPPRLKCFLQYLWDHCDCAGIWEPDFELASMFVGETISETETLDLLKDKVHILPDGKWWIKGFIPFQYGNLSHSCKPHFRIFESLNRNGILTLYKGYAKGIQTLEEEEEDKEEDKEEGVQGEEKREILEKSIHAEQIYQAYPLKVGKPSALKAIKKAMAATTPQVLFERTKSYAEAVNGSGSEFVPHPSTWFNQERFNDDPSTWVRKASDTGNILQLTKQKEVIEKQMADLKRKSFSETQTLHGGTYLPAGWRDEFSRIKFLALKGTLSQLNERISKTV